MFSWLQIWNLNKTKTLREIYSSFWKWGMMPREGEQSLQMSIPRGVEPGPGLSQPSPPHLCSPSAVTSCINLLRRFGARKEQESMMVRAITKDPIKGLRRECARKHSFPHSNTTPLTPQGRHERVLVTLKCWTASRMLRTSKDLNSSPASLPTAQNPKSSYEKYLPSFLLPQPQVEASGRRTVLKTGALTRRHARTNSLREPGGGHRDSGLSMVLLGTLHQTVTGLQP